MAKPRRFSLREERRRIAREFPPLQIVLDDAATDLEATEEAGVLEVPHPATWSDSVLEISAANPIAAARLLVGEEGYELWRAAGGSAAELFNIAQEAAGASTGESSGSSDS